MIRVAVAGASGSIGQQTLDVVRDEPERYTVTGLGVSSAAEVVVEQAKEFSPELVAVADPSLRDPVAAALPGVEVAGEIEALVSGADVVVNGIVGFAGLPVTIATLRAGKRLALANKESLIAAGPVVTPLRATPGAELIPVDSEHCALHQCLRSSWAATGDEVAQLALTASGGPFRGRSAAELAAVTVDEALVHPTWDMGPKITVDSSTLMNKGLEVIEAHELFGVSYDHIDVIIHPQSIVHSMVTYRDGATIAQLSEPDMRLPIAYALAYPHRSAVARGAVDWATLGGLDFAAPDRATFRCLDLAYTAGRTGGTAPAWLSAANEVAVEAFLDKRLSWLQIGEVCDATLQQHDGVAAETVDDVIAADATARRLARHVVQRLAA